MTDELKPEAAPVEPVAARPCPYGFERPCEHCTCKLWLLEMEEAAARHPPAAPTDALVEKVARLEEALEAVWKEATTMRNASKLVGPYPTNPADNRIWARSMYHAGKRIMEMLKPARAALAAMQEAKP